jgi:hypothetical protein
MGSKQKQPFPNPLENALKTGKIGGLSSSNKSEKEDPPARTDQPAPTQEKEPDNLKTVKHSQQKQEPEKATIQFSTYFTRSLYLKLKQFETEIFDRTGKKTDPNKIIRQLVEKASIDDILPLYEEK